MDETALEFRTFHEITLTNKPFEFKENLENDFKKIGRVQKPPPADKKSMATATTTMAMMTSPFRLPSRDYNQHIAFRSLPQSLRICNDAVDTKSCSTITSNVRYRSTCRRNLRPLVSPICATGSGLQASITDPEENTINVKNAKIVTESQDDEKIQVRVDLTGEDTRIVFDKVLSNLARTAPPVPGFRRQKGGKTSKVPKDFLLQMLGEERVMNFVIQEIVSSTLADYAKKENLNVKDNKINTIETAEELRSSFNPGKEFGFSATLELEKTPAETSSSGAPTES